MHLKQAVGLDKQKSTSEHTQQLPQRHYEVMTLK